MSLKKLLPLLALISIIVLVYSSSLKHGFIENWDDNVVLENSEIEGFELEHVKKWFTKGYLGMYQPVTMSTYAINYEIGQFEPFGYHLFNTLIFILVVLLIWRLVYTLTNNYLAAIIAAVFFALHPFAVESIAWTSGRISLMMVLFMLIALNYYASGGRNFIVLFIIYLFAVLSKINGILLPIYLFFIDLAQRNQPFSRKNLIPKAGMLLLSLPILIFSLSLRIPDKSKTFLEMVQLVPAKYLWYLNHILPVYNYSPVYDLPSFFDWRNLVGLTFILFTFWVYRKCSEHNKSLIIMGSLIFLLSLVPHMVPFSLGAQVGDRYGFVSFIGIVIILSSFIDHFSSKPKISIALISVLCIISVVNTYYTYQYSTKWINANTLWSHTVQVVPESSIGHHKLGSWYLLNGDLRAKDELIKSITIDPEYADSHYNLGSLSFYEGNYDDAIEYFTKVYDLEKNDIVLIDRASSYYAKKDYANAIKDLDQYIKKRPDARAFFIRGQSKIALGLDGCSDLKLALDMGIDRALSFYAKNCMVN